MNQFPFDPSDIDALSSDLKPILRLVIEILIIRQSVVGQINQVCYLFTRTMMKIMTFGLFCKWVSIYPEWDQSWSSEEWQKYANFHLKASQFLLIAAALIVSSLQRKNWSASLKRSEAEAEKRVLENPARLGLWRRRRERSWRRCGGKCSISRWGFLNSWILWGQRIQDIIVPNDIFKAILFGQGVLYFVLVG